MYRLHTTSVLGNLKWTSTESFEFCITVCLPSDSFFLFTDIFLNILKCDGALKSINISVCICIRLSLSHHSHFVFFTEIED